MPAKKLSPPRLSPIPTEKLTTAQQAAVSRFIQIWVNRGHLIAKVDPLGLMQRPRPRVLDLDYFGLGEEDLDTEFVTDSRIAEIPRRLKLRSSSRLTPAQTPRIFRKPCYSN